MSKCYDNKMLPASLNLVFVNNGILLLKNA